MTTVAARTGADARWSVESLVGRPIGAADTAGHVPVVGRAAPGFDVSSLLSLDSLDRILTDLPLVYPMVQISEFSRRTPPEAYTVASGMNPDIRYVDPLKLFRCFRAGGSLQFRDVHRYWAPARELSWDLARDLDAGVVVSAYLTPPGVQGLRPHFDYHDVFIVQLTGSKEWSWFARNVDTPIGRTKTRSVVDGVDPTVPGDDAVPIGRHVLSAGDTMYMPRGTSHAVRSLDDVSLHLSIAVVERSAYDAAAALLGRVRDIPHLRTTIPAGPLDRSTLTRSLAAVSAAAEEADLSALDWTVHRDATVDLVESPLALGRQFSCVRDLDESTELVVRPRLIRRTETDSRNLLLRLRDRTMRLPLSAADVLAHALSGDVVSIDTLSAASGIPPGAVGDLVRSLVAEGVLIPATPATPRKESIR